MYPTIDYVLLVKRFRHSMYSFSNFIYLYLSLEHCSLVSKSIRSAGFSSHTIYSFTNKMQLATFKNNKKSWWSGIDIWSGTSPTSFCLNSYREWGKQPRNQTHYFLQSYIAVNHSFWHSRPSCKRDTQKHQLAAEKYQCRCL